MIIWVTDRVAQFFPLSLDTLMYTPTHSLHTHTHPRGQAQSSREGIRTTHCLSVRAGRVRLTEKDDVCLAASRQNCTLGCAYVCAYACLPSIARYERRGTHAQHQCGSELAVELSLLRELKLFSAPLYWGLVYSRSGLHRVAHGAIIGVGFTSSPGNSAHETSQTPAVFQQLVVSAEASLSRDVSSCE